MNKYELVSFKEYPNDPYVMAVAKVRIDGKFLIALSQKKMKDGGLFWSPASISVTDNGEKKYIAAFQNEYRSEDEILIDFVKDSVKQITSKGVRTQDSVFPQGHSAQPTQSGVAAEGEVLPF